MKEFKYIIIPITIIILSQFIKVMIEWVKTKKLNFSRFAKGMGGMPSTHCAVVSSITTLIGIDCGITSSMFGLCMVFTIIIITDAIGIRHESEKHAFLLNRLTNLGLKEDLGHEPIEVLMGIILGTIFSIFFNYII